MYNASEAIYRKHFDAIWEPESRDTYALEGRPKLNDLKIIMKPINEHVDCFFLRYQAYKQTFEKPHFSLG